MQNVVIRDKVDLNLEFCLLQIELIANHVFFVDEVLEFVGFLVESLVRP